MKNLKIFSALALIGFLASCAGGTTNSVSSAFQTSSEVTSSEATSSEATSSLSASLTLSGETSVIRVSETLQLVAHISASSETEVLYSSENTEVATVSESGLVTGVGIGRTNISACLKNDPSVAAVYEITVNELTPSVLTIGGYTSQEVYSGTTLDLSVSILPEAANQSHTWSSDDESVAAITQEGRVFFKKSGDVTITVRSDADDTKKDEVRFHVTDDEKSLVLDERASESVLEASYGSHTVDWCGRSIRLSGACKSAGAFAQLSEGGSVELDAGAYSVQTVTVEFEGELHLDYGFSSTEEKTTVPVSGEAMEVLGNHFRLVAESVSRIVSVTVAYADTHEGILSSFWGSESYDFSEMATSDTPTVTTVSGGFQNAIFNDVRGKYYVTEATIDLPYTAGNWNGFALGHLNAEDGTTFRGLLIDANRQAIVAPTVSDLNVLWGDETDRSQIWGQHGVGSFDYTNLRLTTVRDGAEYYYFINGELYWKDSAGTALDAVDTYPAMHYRNCEVTISDMSILVGEEKVRAYLEAEPSAAKTLYASNQENVEISEDGRTISFKNANSGAPTNLKDTAAKSIGDSMLLKGDKAYDIEFDLTVDEYGATDATPIVAITAKRRTDSPAEARSWEFGEFKAGFAGWNYNGDIPSGIGSGGREYTSALEEGETVHVVLHKLLVDGGCDFSFECKGADHNWDWNGSYAGDLILEFGVRNMDATISDLTITEK